MPADAVIVEAGANDGTDTAAFAGMLPDGQVHAFEPVPSAYERLTRQTGHLPNVLTYPLALGDREGTAPMWMSSEAQQGSSSLRRPTGHIEAFPKVAFADAPVSVDLTTLAAWSERAGVGRVDGMWLDMQGFELAALKGAGALLDSTQALLVEAFRVELYEDAPLWPDVRAWLESRGFRVKTEWWTAEPFGDVLLVRDPDAR